jgi:hypothetical protein
MSVAGVHQPTPTFNLFRGVTTRRDEVGRAESTTSACMAITTMTYITKSPQNLLSTTRIEAGKGSGLDAHVGADLYIDSHFLLLVIGTVSAGCSGPVYSAGRGHLGCTIRAKSLSCVQELMESIIWFLCCHIIAGSFYKMSLRHLSRLKQNELPTADDVDDPDDLEEDDPPKSKTSAFQVRGSPPHRSYSRPPDAQTWPHVT